MAQGINLSRRNCLGLAVGSACAITVGLAGREAWASDLVDRIFSNSLHARSVGQAAVRFGVVPPDLDVIARDLRARRTDWDAAGAVQSIQDDFQAGRMVRLDGWVLSETEALLGAAAYLTM